MAGLAFVIAKEIFFDRNHNILTPLGWLTDEKKLFVFKFNNISINF